MASDRNLTSNAPQFSINDNEDVSSDYNNTRNPFADEEGDISSFSSSSQNQRLNNQQHHNNQQSSHLDSEYGKPFNAYSGYYSNGGSSNLLIHENSSSDETRLLNKDYNNHNKLNPGSPAEFDRYPSMAGSRVVSSTSLASQLYNHPQDKQSSTTTKQQYIQNSTSSNSLDDSSSSKSSSPYPNDFSPFGGYPASSFPLSIEDKEPDDYLHNPDPVKDAEYDKNRFIHDIKNLDKRSTGGLIGIVFLGLAALVVFVVLPAVTYSGATQPYHPQSYEILTHYSYPMLSAIRTNLIDPDTPEDALTLPSKNGDNWSLVFSDEFNADGRTFYEGDDQFFTAPDFHYDATKDLEWYDPDAVTTANGTLTLRMDAFKNHNLFYRSGMVQSWNKLCFTQGRIEISARLPNYGYKTGLWPGLWTMGNLGRPGYLASTEGVWPYSYDSCDAGITPNQSSPDGISYLPGQRLNSCTCPGESHPNRGVGRGAPEIDVIEGEVMSIPAGSKKQSNGVASQSLQLAPMDIWYMPDYNFIEIFNSSITTMNTYAGGPFQQAFSATTMLNITWYERGDGLEHNYQRYGFEFLNDDNDGYLRWFVGRDPTLTVYSNALHPDGNIGWRRISKEPMSIIMNLGISNNWAYIDWNTLVFPTTFHIDYVRVYQPPSQINVGCDPDDYPTYDYIQQHLDIYQNVNLTSFEDAGYTFPKNKLTGGC
ncbi:KRE6 [Candida pseudojiufengensis]|uniref:KRE6 n=1 Tax=Candida pseudojiufengensis TaxID=497109 RepID=UPI002224299D|nr:KRE6 [Candida pseudojiufengensis]KAI5961655.1 KRE6 [Candida pseudojiufengensis]